MEKLCYVSAFLDIGRSEWKWFNRTSEQYIKTFKENFLNHFEQIDAILSQNYELVVFMDKKYSEQIITSNKNIHIIPIDKDSLKDISILWSRLPKEKEIMSSIQYKTMFKNRLHFPENSIPEYTLINHAKIDFVIEAQKYSDSFYFCWIDFGYTNVPKNPINNKLLVDGKINFNLINSLDFRDVDLMYTMHTAPEKIGGGFFWGNKNVLQEYQKLYHDTHQWFQNNNLADDDQHLVLRCYYKNPDLFYLHHIGGWFKMLEHFQYYLPTDTR